MIVPVNLGAASKYEEDIFPLSYHIAGNAISKGSFLLSATLEEMRKIAQIGVDLNTDKRFHYNTRVEYEKLANVRNLPLDLLMYYRQSSSRGSKFENSPKVFQPVCDVPELSSGADVPCCS